MKLQPLAPIKWVLNKLKQRDNDIIAEAWDDDTLCTVGKHVTHKGKLYVCNVPCNGIEPPNASYYSEVKVGNLFPRVLWENPNPNNEITTQTITLNSKDYDIIDVYYKYSTTLSIIFCESCLREASIINLGRAFTNTNASAQAIQRQLYIKDNGLTIQIENGNYQNTNSTTRTADSTKCIPLKIVGYKFN